PTTSAGDTATGERYDIVRWQRDYLCFWRETQSRPHASRDGLSIFRADTFPHCFRESCPAFTRAGRKNGERNPGDCGGETPFCRARTGEISDAVRTQWRHEEKGRRGPFTGAGSRSDSL